jgi:hypothetical protein
VLMGRYGRRPSTLADALRSFLAGPSDDAAQHLPDVEPDDEADALRALLGIYDLWMAPLEQTDGAERYQNHPAIAALKWRLEQAFVHRLDARDGEAVDDTDPVGALRRIAALDLVPAVYEWLASAATWDEAVDFITLEGGPDADFDDLVAIAQVGVTGEAKVALATNYWDELGRGSLDHVHTVLHDRLVEAVSMRPIPLDHLPTSALERKALGGLLVTNRHLQPEALGAFGLLEMQAGPRCRAVVKAFDRLDAPADAYPFYLEHATADPRHGKDWLDRVVTPLSSSPRHATGMVRGARWRHVVNDRFFGEALDLLGGAPSSTFQSRGDTAA